MAVTLARSSPRTRWVMPSSQIVHQTGEDGQRRAVGADQHRVGQAGSFTSATAEDQIVPGDGSHRTAGTASTGRLPPASAAARCAGGQLQHGAVVDRPDGPGADARVALGAQFLLRFEARDRAGRRLQRFRGARHSGRGGRTGGAPRPSRGRASADPAGSPPAPRRCDRVTRRRCRPGAARTLPAEAAGEQPVGKRDPGGADMQRAGGRQGHPQARCGPGRSLVVRLVRAGAGRARASRVPRPGRAGGEIGSSVPLCQPCSPASTTSASSPQANQASSTSRAEHAGGAAALDAVAHVAAGEGVGLHQGGKTADFLDDVVLGAPDRSRMRTRQPPSGANRSLMRYQPS